MRAASEQVTESVGRAVVTLSVRRSGMTSGEERHTGMRGGVGRAISLLLQYLVEKICTLGTSLGELTIELFMLGSHLVEVIGDMERGKNRDLA